MTISAIIPCFNEEHNLAALLRVLRTAHRRWGGDLEVIVVDGGSHDRTACVARGFPEVRLLDAEKCRTLQLRAGVEVSRGDVLYFLHADTRPPLECFCDLERAVRTGHKVGGYAFRFDSASALLRFNSWLTTFNVLSVRGGDQTIFVTRMLYDRLGGFSARMVIMEEYDLLRRAAGLGERYLLFERRTLVSARKYEGASWVRVQVANICAMTMWRTGYRSERIRDTYARLLRA